MHSFLTVFQTEKDPPKSANKVQLERHMEKRTESLSSETQAAEVEVEEGGDDGVVQPC